MPVGGVLQLPRQTSRGGKRNGQYKAAAEKRGEKLEQLAEELTWKAATTSSVQKHFSYKCELVNWELQNS